MKTIYEDNLERVINGASFSVDFKTLTLKVNGKKVIADGVFEGELGIGASSEPITEMERRYRNFRHSIPSERSERGSRGYFRALPEHHLDDEDMMFGMHREEARFELEFFILSQLIHSTLVWNDFAEGKWFWASENEPSLVLLKIWFN